MAAKKTTKKIAKRAAPPRPRVSKGLVNRIGVRLTNSERQAITEVSIKKGINDGDLVREALHAVPGFTARCKRLDAEASKRRG